MDMLGVHFDDEAGEPRAISHRDWLEKLCESKPAFYLGNEKCGKSALQHAVGREMCRRSYDVEAESMDTAVAKPVYYYSSEHDPLGVLSMDGTTDTCSSFQFKDSSFTTLMNSTLSEEERKNLMNVEEDASHRARYHPAKMPSSAPRTFSFNTGRTESGGIDWSASLRAIGLPMLEVLASIDPSKRGDFSRAGRQIQKMSSNDRAVVAKCCIFRVAEPLYCQEARVQKAAAVKQSIADKRRASAACLQQMNKM